MSSRCTDSVGPAIKRYSPRMSRQQRTPRRLRLASSAQWCPISGSDELSHALFGGAVTVIIVGWPRPWGGCSATADDLRSLAQRSFQLAELHRYLPQLHEQVVLGGLDVFDGRCKEALCDCSNDERGGADADQHDEDGDDLALGCLRR